MTRSYTLESCGDVSAFTRCGRCGKAIAWLTHVREWAHVVIPDDYHTSMVPRFVPDLPEWHQHATNLGAATRGGDR